MKGEADRTPIKSPKHKGSPADTACEIQSCLQGWKGTMSNAGHGTIWRLEIQGTMVMVESSVKGMGREAGSPREHGYGSEGQVEKGRFPIFLDRAEHLPKEHLIHSFSFYKLSNLKRIT